MPKKHPVIGIYASAGVGKTLASGYLAEYTGWQLISADDLTHQVLRQENVKKLLQNYFGSDVFTQDNEIDRLCLGNIVFHSASSRALLERCIWPYIEEMIQDKLRQCKQGVIIDAAVLVKARWHRYCNCIIYMESKEALKLKRLMDKGRSALQAQAILKIQADIDRSKVKADYIITNNGTTLELKRKIEKLAKELLFYFPTKATLEMEA
jgi:dephospho-CoA kinase